MIWQASSQDLGRDMFMSAGLAPPDQNSWELTLFLARRVLMSEASVSINSLSRSRAS